MVEGFDPAGQIDPYWAQVLAWTGYDRSTFSVSNNSFAIAASENAKISRGPQRTLITPGHPPLHVPVRCSIGTAPSTSFFAPPSTPTFHFALYDHPVKSSIGIMAIIS